jgi:hypothetical protein
MRTECLSPRGAELRIGNVDALHYAMKRSAFASITNFITLLETGSPQRFQLGRSFVASPQGVSGALRSSSP